MDVEHPDSEGPSDNSLLNEPQLRHFEVFLSMLETALNDIERLASLAPAAGSENLLVHDSDLSHEFKMKAGPAIGVIRERVARLANELGIQPRHRSRTRSVRAILIAELVRLDDSYARKLRGYGAVSPRVQTEVDPALDSMRANIVALIHLAEQGVARKTHR
jgi:hypothetical protein